MNNQGQVSGQQGDGLGPAGADVGHHQAVDEGARQWTAAVGYQVDLQVARWGLVPVVVGPYRNPVSHGFPTAPTTTAASRGPDRLQQPVQGGCAGGEQPFPDQGVQLQVTVALPSFF